jgi:hypothetical protein
MKKIILFFLTILFSISLLISAENQQLDLNQASLDEIKSLPITEKQAEDIYSYRTYIKFFESVYDLRDIKSIDQITFNRIKSLAKISPYTDYDEVAQRKDQINYLLRRLASNEGSQEGISDLWGDLLISPININTATFHALLNMPIVTPSDVKAILQQRKLGEFSDYSSMRKSLGLTHYGATNLQHYVIYYTPEGRNRWFFNYRFKLNDSPYSEELEEVLRESFVPDSTNEKFSMWGKYHLDNAAPETSHKFRVRMEDWINLEFGSIFFLKKGENRDLNFLELTNECSETIKDNSNASFTADITPIKTKVILGNYRATFGQGLVMENTDYFDRRRTGFGYGKRVLGIFPDLSPTEEFALKGGAVEFNNNFLNASVFYSNDKKDAVVWDSNNDGIIDDDDDLFYYIISKPRFSNEELESAEEYFNQYRPGLSDPKPEILMSPRRDALKEILRGGHIELSPVIGTHLGITAYETEYDRYFKGPFADYNSIGNYFLADPVKYTKKIKMTDSEISSLYSTKTENYERDYRRVYGFDWQTTLKNLSFQGEYAELEVNGKPTKLGDDPKAIVASGYLGFENLNFLMLYRNYDLAFDNPYARPFAEHERFDGTILEQQYYLKNPLVSEVYYNSPWSQPEEGIYIESRYKFHRQLTLTKVYLDIWKRKSDGRRSIRFQGELDYRPIYQVSIRLKEKLQTNRSEDTSARSVSKTSETTLKFISYLTNRDKLELEYRFNKVWMAPYTSLTNSAEPGEAIVPTADVLNHGDYIAANYTHNFTDYFQIEGSFLFWNGHGISHWDWEDMEIDFMGSEGMKYWFTIYDRISNHLAVSFKYKIKHYKDEELYLRKYNDPEAVEGQNYVSQTKHKESSIRLQIDWNF